MRSTILAATTLAAATVLTAAPAQAAPAPATTTTSSLDVWIRQATASVTPSGMVVLDGGYACQDADHTGNARIRLDLAADNNAHGTADVTVPCQTADGTFTTTVTPDAGSPVFTRDHPAEAHATITRSGQVGEEATAEAILFNHPLFLRANPTLTPDASGGYTATGTYGCSSTAPTVNLTLTLTDRSAAGIAVGSALASLPCPATDQPWTATVALPALPAPSTQQATGHQLSLLASLDGAGTGGSEGIREYTSLKLTR
ncbi:hypothetical protein ACIGXM_23705 [Kitasatospora sp. NPDC052896]|uniref:hypothetical protein n=1 Tax=Kitasatospora sp. NPDC052896 TaxID=3364061 RepID=UPI0037C7FF0E